MKRKNGKYSYVREASLILVFLIFFVQCGTVSHQQEVAAVKPNFLFVAVDDLNDWIGYMGGHPQVQTPYIDKLFAEGVLFTNAHASQPVCTASRSSLLSGLHPSTTGWYNSTKEFQINYDEVMEGNMMLPEYMRAHGYYTMSVGKIAHNGASDFRHKTDDYWDLRAPNFWTKMDDSIRDGGFGYRGWMFYPFPKNGGQFVDNMGPDSTSYWTDKNRWYSLCGGPLDEEDIPSKGMYDEQVLAWAQTQLQGEYDKPFFMAVGFLRPHVPYAVPRKYFDMYDQNELKIPVIPDDDMSDIPLYGKAIAKGYTPNGGWADVHSVENMHRELVHSYLASVSFVDDQIGKLIESLKSSNYAKNTVIVFWSDHGQHLGEKRHYRKQALWEESTRVPLFVYDPRTKTKGKRDMAVSLLDVYPTILSLAGLPENQKNEGFDLSDIIEDDSQTRDKPVLTSWKYGNFAVRSDNWRYIQYRDGSEELYDHASDQEERYNLVDNSDLQDLINDHKQWIPQNPQLPPGQTEWKEDNLDKYVKAWENGEPIPRWLE